MSFPFSFSEPKPEPKSEDNQAELQAAFNAVRFLLEENKQLKALIANEMEAHPASASVNLFPEDEEEDDDDHDNMFIAPARVAGPAPFSETIPTRHCGAPTDGGHGPPCRLKTRHPSGRCFHHRGPAKMTVSRRRRRRPAPPRATSPLVPAHVCGRMTTKNTPCRNKTHDPHGCHLHR